MASASSSPFAIQSADRSHSIIVSISTCIVLATLAVLGRILSRRLMKHIFTWSDYLMVLSYFGSITVSGIVLAGASKLKSLNFMGDKSLKLSCAEVPMGLGKHIQVVDQGSLSNILLVCYHSL